MHTCFLVNAVIYLSHFLKNGISRVGMKNSVTTDTVIDFDGPSYMMTSSMTIWFTRTRNVQFLYDKWKSCAHRLYHCYFQLWGGPFAKKSLTSHNWFLRLIVFKLIVIIITYLPSWNCSWAKKWNGQCGAAIHILWFRLDYKLITTLTFIQILCVVEFAIEISPSP